MADFVDDDGWISDESDFYGGESTKRRLERKTKRKLELPTFFPSKRPRTEELEKPSLTGQAAQTGQSGQDVLSILKSRPQIALPQKAAAQDREPTKKPVPRNLAGAEAAEFSDDNSFDGVPSARQRNETVDSFLKRAPVGDPETSALGPWLWIGNPNPIRSQHEHHAKADVAAFTAGGKKLLAAFSSQRVKLETSMPDKTPATITRKLGPYKEQLEDDLLSLAVKTATTCGKWMFFPSAEDYPRYWRVVAEATADGRLGITSKAATFDALDPIRLICVYTYDFTDRDDVSKVLEALVELGLCQSDGKPIYYKCDAYTYLGISSDNKYKLRASLYSSKDILVKEVKPKADGSVARLKENQTMANFFEL